MIIVCGASQNHYKSLKQFMRSYLKYYANDTSCKLIVYNLGIAANTWNHIVKYFKNKNILYKTFDYTKYPAYFNININAGEYAWKPTIIYQTSLEYPDEILIWMDSGNLIEEKLDVMINDIKVNHVHTPVSSNDIKFWTHPTTIKNLNCQHLDKNNRAGGCVGFNLKTPWIKDFINEWKDCAFNKDIIAPEGSNRTNHRQDQAVLSILYYQYKEKYKFNDYYNSAETQQKPGYSIHKDIDNRSLFEYYLLMPLKKCLSKCYRLAKRAFFIGCNQFSRLH